MTSTKTLEIADALEQVSLDDDEIRAFPGLDGSAESLWRILVRRTTAS